MYWIACTGDRYLFYGFMVDFHIQKQNEYILFLAQHELQELGHFLAQFTKLPKIKNSPFFPIGIFIQSHRFFSFSSFCWPQTNIFSSILWEILITIKNAVEIQLLWVVTLILMTFFVLCHKSDQFFQKSSTFYDFLNFHWYGEKCLLILIPFLKTRHHKF